MMIVCRGRLIPVLPGYTGAIKQLSDYLTDLNATDVVLILDESDNMWVRRESPNAREELMYAILSDPHNNKADEIRLLERSRVRSFVQISATHLATVVWHTVLKLPFKAMIADDNELHQAGYMMPSDFSQVMPPLGEGSPDDVLISSQESSCLSFQS